MTVEQRVIGRAAEGEVAEYTVVSGSGLTMRVMSFGATLTSLEAPDRDGRIGEITLGYRSAAEFLSTGNKPYFGVTVGRFANRIRDGRFELDGREYRLARNEEDRHHLHGGVRGFDKRLWRGEVFQGQGKAGVRFRYRSPAGEEGYPGTLDVTAEYALGEDATLAMSYEARTDAPTVLNLANHAYWNLAGKGTVVGHFLRIQASRHLGVDASLMPTGILAEVGGSPFDFRAERLVGERMDAAGGGYDHCYVLDGGEPGAPLPAVALRDPGSGRTMELWTTQPGVQLYTGNFLELAGFRRHQALCLETQHYPDCVNHPEFPSPVLRPGELFRHTTIHRFSVR